MIAEKLNGLRANGSRRSAGWLVASSAQSVGDLAALRVVDDQDAEVRVARLAEQVVETRPQVLQLAAGRQHDRHRRPAPQVGRRLVADAPAAGPDPGLDRCGDPPPSERHPERAALGDERLVVDGVGGARVVVARDENTRQVTDVRRRLGRAEGEVEMLAAGKAGAEPSHGIDERSADRTSADRGSPSITAGPATSPV